MLQPIRTHNADRAATHEAIGHLKEKLGRSVCILGHHYQSAEVIRHCDARGDSLELARMIADIEAEHIVFCGVSFMGESAAILTRPGQAVYLPDKDAECAMALTSPAALVDRVYSRIVASGRKLTPLAYVNTSVGVKAVVGRHGGAVCTSANARDMLEWALEQGDGVFFLPDKNLARNTASVLGIDAADIHILDISRGGAALDEDAIRRARIVVWPGQCAIHARFRAGHIAEARKATPGCTVTVHPECAPDVVAAADVSGSTTAIIRVVREARPGDTVYVGTESNLVWRLAEESVERQVTVKPLAVSTCSNMARVTPENLKATLESIAEGTARPVHVDERDAEPARASLRRMLDAMHR